MEDIRIELNSNIDKFSQNIIISHIETRLIYAARFYMRQFITRQKRNNQILEKLEEYLDYYFNQEDLINIDLPTVKAISTSLNISSKYLSSLLQLLIVENHTNAYSL